MLGAVTPFYLSSLHGCWIHISRGLLSPAKLESDVREIDLVASQTGNDLDVRRLEQLATLYLVSVGFRILVPFGQSSERQAELRLSFPSAELRVAAILSPVEDEDESQLRAIPSELSARYGLVVFITTRNGLIREMASLASNVIIPTQREITNPLRAVLIDKYVTEYIRSLRALDLHARALQLCRETTGLEWDELSRMVEHIRRNLEFSRIFDSF